MKSPRQLAIEASGRPFALWDDSRVVRREGWLQVITPSVKTAANEVIHSVVPAERADRVIRRTVGEYRALGIRTKWCVGPWTGPDDFGERLSAFGFDHWDVRGMAVETAPGQAPDIARVQDAAALERHIAAASRGWEVSSDVLRGYRASLVRAFSAPEEGNRVVFFSAIAGGQVVGTAASVVREDHVYLVGAQVLPSARGRGLYRQLIDARLDHAARLGIPIAVTQAREATSAPRLQHLGFDTVFRSRCYVLD